MSSEILIQYKKIYFKKMNIKKYQLNMLKYFVGHFDQANNV